MLKVTIQSKQQNLKTLKTIVFYQNIKYYWVKSHNIIFNL
jgi:hypothetical protein